MKAVFDIETNGLDPSKIHCLVIRTTERPQHPEKYFGEDIESGVQKLLDYSFKGEIIGHNIIGYDIPVLQKFYPWFIPKRSSVVDTLILSRLYNPDIFAQDSIQASKGKFPKKLCGLHSLKSWGYRLGFHKGTYAEETENAWEEFSLQMLEYCAQDTAVTLKLYQDVLMPFYNRALQPYAIAFLIMSLAQLIALAGKA